MRLYYFIFINLIFGSSLANGKELFNIYYEDSYPYFYLVNKQTVGTQFKRLSDALNKTNYEIKWVSTSYKRILILLGNPDFPVCAIGFSKNPDRLKKYVFSKPLFSVGRDVLFFKRDHLNEVKKYKSLSDFILKSKLRGGFIGVKESWIPVMDEISQTASRHTFHSDGDNISLKLLLRGRVDFIFIDENAANHYQLTNPDTQFVQHDFKTGRPMRPLHLMCSININTELIKSFNDEIEYQ